MKDVPTGYKYKIVEEEDLPTDRSFRDAWTVDVKILRMVWVLIMEF